MKRYLRKAKNLAAAAISSPRRYAQLLSQLGSRLRAEQYVLSYREQGAPKNETIAPPANPLREYFENHTEGHGIWKWQHYFELYQRHFSKFVGQSVNVLEIGIYSGGSLDMWHSYFGAGCHIYGVDIENACKSYENEHTTVFIGDQANRGFWKDFRSNTPPIDILIDDGGHTPEQQRITLEEMLPYLRCGGVYFCEDVHGESNDFAAYATTLVYELNHTGDLNGFQKSIHSIHFYPFCVIIEKHAVEPERFFAPKHGTRWQPFFDK
ncbi:MAG: class I SAM-dependent methyltransferase [Planctomycetes bacterium]|nr:class I SAM-dependent methyltransferase [Planctomycetota bacterium]